VYIIELTRLRPDYYVCGDDRDFVKSRMEAGHPPIPVDGDIKKYQG